MAETYEQSAGRTVRAGQRSQTTVGPTVRGELAGQDARFNEVERQQRLQQFLKEKGWAGLGGARNRPPQAELDRQFESWLSSRPKKPDYAREVDLARRSRTPPTPER